LPRPCTCASALRTGPPGIRRIAPARARRPFSVCHRLTRLPRLSAAAMTEVCLAVDNGEWNVEELGDPLVR